MTNMNGKWVLLGAVGVALVVGCKSRQTGLEGNLEFSYIADDDVADFNKPVGIGATLELEVREAGERRPVTVTAAAFEDPAILDVEDFGGGNVLVLGKGDGQTFLDVEATLESGESVTDRVPLSAAEPEVVVLAHTCVPAETRTAAYLAGQRVFVRYELELANGRAVIGEGLYPFTSSDAGFALNEAESGRQFAAFDTGAGAVTATLSSEVDDTTLEARVVTPGDIDGIADPAAFVLEDIDVGDTNDFYVLPKVGEDIVCQADIAKTVVSDTPDLCTVEEREVPAQAGDDRFEAGWFKVTGVAAGECLYTVSYPDGAGGAGVSQQFSFTIEP